MKRAEPSDPVPVPDTPANGHDERHSRKCTVCNHPDRDLIEAAFIDWGSPHRISTCYRLPDGSLRRHARAVGLYARRRGNLRAALDNILERSAGAKVTGDTVIRAVRAYACLTDDNKWIEPPARVVFSSQAAPVSVNPPAPAPQLSAPAEFTVQPRNFPQLSQVIGPISATAAPLAKAAEVPE